MTVLILIFISVFAFLIGFLTGAKRPIKAKKSSGKFGYDLQNITKEYENFLNYDGSEQQ